MKEIILKTNRLILRKIKTEDSARASEIGNNKKITNFVGSMNYPFNLSESKKWNGKALMQKNSNYFSIIFSEANEIVGFIWIENIDRKKNAGEIGFWLGKNYQGKGLSNEATKLIVQFCFKFLRLRKIVALTTNYNKNSQRLLERVGFILEGYLRQDYKDKKLGKWVDVMQYGILKSEWKR